MALRWCAAGMLEADHQFRRVNGHLHQPKLRAALEAHFTENVSIDTRQIRRKPVLNGLINEYTRAA